MIKWIAKHFIWKSSCIRTPATSDQFFSIWIRSIMMMSLTRNQPKNQKSSQHLTRNCIHKVRVSNIQNENEIDTRHTVEPSIGATTSCRRWWVRKVWKFSSMPTAGVWMSMIARAEPEMEKTENEMRHAAKTGKQWANLSLPFSSSSSVPLTILDSLVWMNVSSAVSLLFEF